MSNPILTILVSVISVGVAVAAFLAASRATRIQARSADHAVDAAAYGRATSIYESTITALRTEVTRLTGEVQGARTEIREVRDDLTKLQVTNQRLVSEITHIRVRSQEHDADRAQETRRLRATYGEPGLEPDETP